MSFTFMKKKSTSQSGLFNLRVLIAVCIVFVGACLALAGFGVFPAVGQIVGKRPTIITHSNNPLVPVPFDCSRIQELGIDKQVNIRARAIMIACGEAGEGQPTTSPLRWLSGAVKKLLMP